MLVPAGIITFFRFSSITSETLAGLLGGFVGGTIGSLVWIYIFVAVARGIYINKIKEDSE